MTIKYYHTQKSFRAAVAQAKAEGYKFLGYTWDAACFVDLVLVRTYRG